MELKSKVLYIDDDKENLTGFKASLSRTFHILTAENPQEALTMLRSTSNDIGVVLVDYKMPNEDGISFVARIRDEFPHLIFIITSAWADMDVVIKAMNMNCFYGFIQKPWNYDELKITLKNALEHYETCSDNKRLNAELIRQNKALEEAVERERNANRVKNVFLQNVSHEIRTPLNSIIGFSSLIKQHSPTDGKISAYSDLVIQGGYELLKTIHNILESAIIFSNQVVVNKVTFSITALLKRLINEVEERVSRKKLALQFGVGNEIFISNDELKIQLILQILIDNVIKFTSKGTISIEIIDNHEMSEGDGAIVVKVSDTGIGIEKNNIDKIFQPFQQANDTDSRQFRGSGMGLFIAKSYAVLLGGGLWVESVPLKGSSFFLSIKKECTTTC